MKLHALVEDLATARAAVEGGATVVQLRVKQASTRQLVELGRPLRELDAMLVVNDDVTAAIQLEADGVHLGRDDEGAERALDAGPESGAPRGTSARRSPRSAPAPRTSAQGRSGRRRRRTTPMRRSVSTAWPGSPTRSRSP